MFIDIFTVHSQGRKGRLRPSAPGRQQRHFCGKISLFHSLKPPARDMCSAPFPLIDNWNFVYVLQGYYFSQRIFFFQLQLTPDSTHCWFPTLDTSCSSRALCTACAHHQLQFGALNVCCCFSRPWHHNPKTISRIQIHPRIQTCLRIWHSGSFWAVFWILEGAYLRATRLRLCFSSELVRGVHARASIKWRSRGTRETKASDCHARGHISISRVSRDGLRKKRDCL